MLQPINSPGANFPGISQAIVVRKGRPIFLSGLVPADPKGALVVGDFETQLEAVFQSIGRTLRAANVGFEALVRLTIHIAGYGSNMLPILRRLRARYVSSEVPPASVLVAVAGLYDPRVQFEIEAIAVVPE